MCVAFMYNSGHTQPITTRNSFYVANYISALLFTGGWREKRWIHAFLKGIRIKLNENSLVQDLNSEC